MYKEIEKLTLDEFLNNISNEFITFIDNKNNESNEIYGYIEKLSECIQGKKQVSNNENNQNNASENKEDKDVIEDKEDKEEVTNVNDNINEEDLNNENNNENTTSIQTDNIYSFLDVNNNEDEWDSLSESSNKSNSKKSKNKHKCTSNLVTNTNVISVLSMSHVLDHVLNKYYINWNQLSELLPTIKTYEFCYIDYNKLNEFNK